jgi:hypothetical protein
MTEQSGTDSDAVLVVLGIAKKSHDAVVSMPSGKRFYTKVSNSHEGYQQLLPRTGVDPPSYPRTVAISGLTNKSF